MVIKQKSFRSHELGY